MDEQFMYFIWSSKLFKCQDLQTVDGKPLEIVHLGQRNHNSGPDFLNAKIKIDKQLWAGNVEMHVKASDWQLHKHQHNPAFDNVILHVILINDKYQPQRVDGTLIETFNLQDYLIEETFHRYENLKTSLSPIPCGSKGAQIDSFIRDSTLESVLFQRLEHKHQLITKDLEQFTGNWDQIFLRHLFKYFGFKINNDAFLALADSLPISVLAKLRHNTKTLEAVLLGQAGFLNQPKDEYSLELQEIYRNEVNKYKLTPVNPVLWKLMRLRPANFPDLRIAQLSALIHKNAHLFSEILLCKNLADFYNLFQVNASNYWENHYLLGKRIDQAHSSSIGKQSIDLLLINVVLPLKFAYHQQQGKPDNFDEILSMYMQIKAEENKITKIFKDLDWPLLNAFQSQAYLELDKNYCSEKKCLQCGIGAHLLRKH